MDLSKTIILTDRLRLVPLSREYADIIFKEFTPEITRFMFPKSPSKIEETQEYIDAEIPKIKNGEELPVVIFDKNTGEFLGAGGAHALQTATPALGIWIKKSAHGNKYGREAVKGLKDWIDKNISYNYIAYPVDKENISSRKIAESLGGIIEAEYPKESASGTILNIVEYRIYKK